jgi:hypothetical protein
MFVRREISAITAVNFVGQSSTVVDRCFDRCFDRRLVRVRDASSLPPDRGSRRAARVDAARDHGGLRWRGRRHIAAGSVTEPGPGYGVGHGVGIARVMRG